MLAIKTQTSANHVHGSRPWRRTNSIEATRTTMPSTTPAAQLARRFVPAGSGDRGCAGSSERPAVRLSGPLPTGMRCRRGHDVLPRRATAPAPLPSDVPSPIAARPYCATESVSLSPTGVSRVMVCVGDKCRVQDVPTPSPGHVTPTLHTRHPRTAAAPGGTRAGSFRSRRPRPPAPPAAAPGSAGSASRRRSVPRPGPAALPGRRGSPCRRRRGGWRPPG